MVALLKQVLECPVAEETETGCCVDSDLGKLTEQVMKKSRGLY